jgi:hypothetical protein
MSMENFVARAKVMVRYVEDIPFPGVNPPTVDDTKLKNIIFCAMPPAWQTNFLRGNHVLTTSVLELQQFMAQEREFAEPMQEVLVGETTLRKRIVWHILVMLGALVVGTCILAIVARGQTIMPP